MEYPNRTRMLCSLGVFWFLTRRFRKWIFVVLSGVLLAGVVHTDLGPLPSGEVGMAIWAFSFGVVMALFQDRIKIGLPLLTASALVAIVLSESPLREVSFILAFSALFLFLSTRSLLLKFRLPGDYSYGVYLYGWPIQQVLLLLKFSDSTIANQIMSMAIAVAVGAASWHLIEKPTLLLGKKWSSKI